MPPEKVADHHQVQGYPPARPTPPSGPRWARAAPPRRQNHHGFRKRVQQPRTQNRKNPGTAIEFFTGPGTMLQLSRSCTLSTFLKGRRAASVLLLRAPGNSQGFAGAEPYKQSSGESRPRYAKSRKLPRVQSLVTFVLTPLIWIPRCATVVWVRGSSYKHGSGVRVVESPREFQATGITEVYSNEESPEKRVEGARKHKVRTGRTTLSRKPPTTDRRQENTPTHQVTSNVATGHQPRGDDPEHSDQSSVSPAAVLVLCLSRGSAKGRFPAYWFLASGDKRHGRKSHRKPGAEFVAATTWCTEKVSSRLEDFERAVIGPRPTHIDARRR